MRGKFLRSGFFCYPRASVMTLILTTCTRSRLSKLTDELYFTEERLLLNFAISLIHRSWPSFSRMTKELT